jgi:hypothetical protein
MRLQRGTLNYEETAESRRRHGDEDFQQLDVEWVFSAILECQRCNDKVSCCGMGGNEPFEHQDEDGDFVTDYSPVFFPEYFSKPMPLVSVPSACPDAVKKSLNSSFLVCFCDVGAAANHVRQCAEEILTHAGVAGRNAKGGFISLGTRVKAFEAVDQENAERVSALRWIGNFGSHPETITREGVFDAYDITEVLLEDLYVGHQRSVRQIVERVNKARRPSR